MKAFLVFLAVCVTNACAIETVRIDGSGGAPRILVDGKPVRARFFFGNPGTFPLAAGVMGKQVSFDFTADDDAFNQGTMHFRFGDTPGDVYLSNIQVEDLAAKHDLFPTATFSQGEADFQRDWQRWPPTPKDTLDTVSVEPGQGEKGASALHVNIQAPPAGTKSGFHIFHRADLGIQRGHHYHVSFWVRAAPARQINVAFYRPGKSYVYLGGADVFQPQIKMAVAAGVRFVSFFVDPPWAPPGTTPDWSQVDAACQRVIDANPDALLVPRIGMWAPDWWLKAHPDDLMRWDKRPSAKDGRPMASITSPSYRHDAAEQLRAFVTHVEQKFGPHVAGYHPAGQNTEEWFYEATWSRQLNGYGKTDLIAWRKWLLDRYGTDLALRAAWHQPGAALASVQVPSPEARRGAPAGVLRDPATEQPVIDFTEFQQQSMADCVCELAHVAREAATAASSCCFSMATISSSAARPTGPASPVTTRLGNCWIHPTSTSSARRFPILTVASTARPRS